MKFILTISFLSLVVASCASVPSTPQQTKVYPVLEILTNINSGKTEVIGKGLDCEQISLRGNTQGRTYFLVEEGVFDGRENDGKFLPWKQELYEDGETY